MDVSNSTAASAAARAVSYDTSNDPTDGSTNGVGFEDIMAEMFSRVASPNPTSDPADPDPAPRTSTAVTEPALPQNLFGDLADTETSTPGTSTEPALPFTAVVAGITPFNLSGANTSGVAIPNETPEDALDTAQDADTGGDADATDPPVAIATSSTPDTATAQLGPSALERSLSLLLANQLDVAMSATDGLEALRATDS